ncbi:uncharacterized protein BJX67DRAFT_232869 [Aspergillus lucknowensis]|uniref:Uncharacterized protein n=1 Tax=Aspergillus lucknowensis TaxID=176173 RepID=A0ABR4LH85_9EURO
MPQELPTNLSTSFPNDLGFPQENEIPSGSFFESPRGWRAKSMRSQRPESASPPLAQRSSQVFDILGGDDDDKDILSRFPRMYSSLMSERDPFLDQGGIPLNPHNTPTSLSGRQSETGYSAKGQRSSLSTTKIERDSLDQLNDADHSGGTPFIPLPNTPKSRPPKPPKPSFLSDIELSSRSEVGTVQPTFSLEPSERRILDQFAERPAVERARERHSSGPRRPWETRSVVPCRYFPRPFSHHELEILGIPLKNPHMAFPAPIPTIDNLPLRRGIVNFDWKREGRRPADTNDLSEMEKPARTKASSVWNLSQEAFSFGRLGRNIMGSILPWKNRRPNLKESPVVHTTPTVPRTSRPETHSLGPELTSVVGAVDGEYIVRISIAFPIVFVHHITVIVTTARDCMCPEAALKAALIGWALLKDAVRWLLAVLRIRVAVELKQVQGD